MTARALGSSSPTALLNPAKPPRGHHLNALFPRLVPGGEPGPEDLPGPARSHVQQTRWPRLVAYGGGRSMMTAGVLVAFFAVTPHTGGTSRTRAKRARGIIDPKDLYAVEAVRGAGDGLLDLGRECVVGGVPGDPQGSCYPADRHALQGKGPQPPLHCRAGQPRSGPAKVEASCLHTRRQRVQAKRRRPCRRGPRTRSAYGTPQWPLRG